MANVLDDPLFFFKLTQNILNWNILLQVYSQRFRKVNHLTKVNEVAISLPHSHLHLLFNTLDLVLTISLMSIGHRTNQIL